MAQYRVAEIFSSINGEGPRSGQLAFFIRMQGCNLNCSYCDTRWACKTDAEVPVMSTKEILSAVRDSMIYNVTLTGGEPLIQEDVSELIEALAKEPQIRIEVETNGSIPLAPFLKSKDLLSFNMDYKLPGSGMEERMVLENFDILTQKDAVKFVVEDRPDLLRSLELIQKYDLTERCQVYFSPVYGKMKPEEIVNFMKEYQMNDVRLQLQIHKIVWDGSERGV